MNAAGVKARASASVTLSTKSLLPNSQSTIVFVGTQAPLRNASSPVSDRRSSVGGSYCASAKYAAVIGMPSVIGCADACIVPGFTGHSPLTAVPTGTGADPVWHHLMRTDREV